MTRGRKVSGEVLAGARSNAREADLRRLLLRFHLYQFDPAADFDGAARIYRRCRQAAITPRGLPRPQPRRFRHRAAAAGRKSRRMPGPPCPARPAAHPPAPKLIGWPALAMLTVGSVGYLGYSASATRTPRPPATN